VGFLASTDRVSICYSPFVNHDQRRSEGDACRNHAHLHIKTERVVHVGSISRYHESGIVLCALNRRLLFSGSVRNFVSAFSAGRIVLYAAQREQKPD